MSNTVIEVENVWKQYRLGVINHHTLTRDLQSWWAKVRGMEDPNLPIGTGPSSSEERFWALRDVSFQVKQGDIIGIIGRNGAGKSTLLKILSQVTSPSRGEVRFKGRIASLLEVGTGFHPELTGRENIYLNGAILGLIKSEIKNKLDEIIAFSDVEKFIDTPVKRYSSGMYVRLAFAVAAHLEPEILIVDEVLAVGDAQFQKKCLGKMGEVGRNGRTVLFVSHNMGAIQQLCNKAILMNMGGKVFEGEACAVVTQYFSAIEQARGESYQFLDEPKHRAWIDSARIVNNNEGIAGSILMSEDLLIECHLIIMVKSHLTLSVQIKEATGSPIFHFPNSDAGFTMPKDTGSYKLSVAVPALWLYPGKYSVQLTLCESVGQHYETIHIVDTLVFTCEQDYTACSRSLGRHAGLVFSQAKWRFEPVIGKQSMLGRGKTQYP